MPDRAASIRGTILPVPIILINLDRSPERLDAMRRQLGGLGLAYDRLPATDGARLDPGTLARYYSEALNLRQYHKRLTSGEIGCYISHLRAWEMIVARGWDYALVLEDDLVLRPEFPDALAALAALPAGWEMVKLVGGRAKAVAHRIPMGKFSLVDYYKAPVYTSAQAVSRTAAEKLLRTRLPFGRPADVDLQLPWETGVRVQGLEPHPVIARADLPSTINHVASRKSVPTRRLAFLRQRAALNLKLLGENLRAHGPAVTLRCLVLKK